MKKVFAKILPNLLDNDQKERRMQVCQDIIKYLQTELDLLRRVIIREETLILKYDPVTKRQAEESKTLNIKTMLITFFN